MFKWLLSINSHYVYHFFMFAAFWRNKVEYKRAYLLTYSKTAFLWLEWLETGSRPIKLTALSSSTLDLNPVPSQTAHVVCRREVCSDPVLYNLHFSRCLYCKHIRCVSQSACRWHTTVHCLIDIEILSESRYI